MADLDFQGQPSRSLNLFQLVDIPDLNNARIDTKIKSVLCLQPEITKVIPVHVYDLEFQGQPSRSRDLFWFIWDPRPRECWNRHQDQVCSMCTTRDNRGHVGVCLTLIFKVKSQGHEINSSFWFNPTYRLHIGALLSAALLTYLLTYFFDIPDLKIARIDTKIEFVSRFLQEVTKVIPVHIYDLDFQGQPLRPENWF